MSDEQPTFLEEEEPLEQDSAPGPYQFGLRAVFAVTTAAAVYFGVERFAEGRFALVSAAAALIAIGTIPIIYVLLWVARSIMEAGEPTSTIVLMLAIIGAVLGCLLLFPGF